MGDATIQKQPNDSKYNYEFIIRFTGKKFKEEIKKELNL